MAQMPRITSSDLFVRQKKSLSSSELNRGNVALKVERYERDDQDVVRAVTGTNLETGEVMTIKLASVDEMVEFYSPQSKDRGVRVAEVEKRIAARPKLSDFASVKGNKSTPAPKNEGDEAGVLKFDSVKADLKNPGEFFSTWVTSLVRDPQTEVALHGNFEITEHMSEAKKERYLKSSLLFSDQTIVGGNREKLDDFLSGKLPERDRQADAETFVAVTVYPAAGDPGVPLTSRLYSPPARSPEGQVIGRQAGVEAAVTVPVLKTKPAAFAATAAAAAAGIEFDRLKFSNDLDREAFKELYDGVQSGRHKVGFTPGVGLFVLPRLTDDVFNRRLDEKSGVIKELSSPTRESFLLGRGYVRGAVAVRFFDVDKNRYTSPAVKALSTTETFYKPANDPGVLKENQSKVCQDVIDGLSPSLHEDIRHDATQGVGFDDDPLADAGYSGSGFSPN